jgi:predicted PurR-regulated permease PerM
MTLPMQIWYLRRRAGISILDTSSAIAAPFVASSVMGVGVWSIVQAMKPHVATPLAAVAIAVAAGVAIYGAVLLLVSAQVRDVIRRRLRLGVFARGSRMPAGPGKYRGEP